jgi:hypothetical protein
MGRETTTVLAVIARRPQADEAIVFARLMRLRIEIASARFNWR